MTGAKLAAVVGYPVGHSLSPTIHRIWAAREGANAYYIPVEAGEGFDAFARAADSLSALGFAGCNVTIPHKENALRYAGRSSEQAESIGAANMLTFCPDGAYADNSDMEGFKQALLEALQSPTARKRALVLGAGGAARGVVRALQEMDYDEITIANRTRKRAEVMVKDFAGVEVIDWKDREKALSGADLLVNSTSLGMSGAPPLEIALDGLSDHAVVADIVYSPLQTTLLRAAAARGFAAVDGLSMLMHQAVPGYLAWLGKSAEVDDDLRRRLVGALKARAL